MAKIIEFSRLKAIKHQPKIQYEKEATVSSDCTLYMLIGIPCSGKSTYAKELSLKDPRALIISTDEIRKEITGKYAFSSDTNEIVFDIAKETLRNSLMQRNTVIFDATNTNKKYRKSILDIAKKMQVKVIGIVFKTPIMECLKRNSLRSLERRVPEDIIFMMSKYDSNISKSEGFDQVIVKK